MAMTFPEHHCIGEYVIPCRNAISVNAGLGQCRSTSYPQSQLSEKNTANLDLSIKEIFSTIYCTECVIGQE
ncbi:MAG: hypothetical protein IKB16_01880 [Lentisphaeria bacterium]|nr:hypothetical protein [Lentisphaeria bacterium]